MKRSSVFQQIAITVAVSLVSFGHSGGQEAQPRFEGRVEVVAVDANVVDDKGQPIRDLTADEFTVKVDGRTRKVLSAEFVELATRTVPALAPPPAPATEGTASAPAAPPRTEGRRIVLVVDRGQLGGSVHLAAQAASRLLDQLGPHDRVAVFPLPSGPRVDFTSDRDAIAKVLGKIGPLNDTVFSEFNISYAESLTFVDGRGRDSAIALRECEKWMKDGELAIQACVLRVEAEARRQVEDHERGVKDRLNALEALCQALARVPGPKSLVLISGGFTSAMTGRESVSQQLRRIATAAAAARVSVYSIYFSHRVDAFDASRSREQYTPQEDKRLMSAGLEQFTGMAGGAMFEVVAGANSAFDRVASETSAHYLLGLEPGRRDRDGKPHEIEVKVTRKGAQVRARRQFVMAPDSAPRVTRARAVAPAPPSSPLRVATHVLRGDSDNQIRIVMAAQVDGFADARFDIKVLNPRGGVVGSLAEQVTPPAGEPVRHQETLILPRGLYTLRAEAIEKGGRTAQIERPLNAELAHGVGFDVSDLMLMESTEGKMRLSPTGSMASDTMGAYLELYVQPELPTDRIAVAVEVIGKDGLRRSSTPLALQKDPAKGLIYAEGVVDLWALPPGSYVARALISFGTKVARRIERPFEYKDAMRPKAPIAQR